MSETALAWLAKIFEAAAAQKGGVVRRNKNTADRIVGFENLVAAVIRLGFQLFEAGDQYIIVCNRAAIRQHC
jgi:hypothetical protein